MTAATSRENRWGAGGGTAAKAPGAKIKAAPPEPEPPKAKSSFVKSKKFLIIVAVVLAAAGGAYTYLKPVALTPISAGDKVSLDPTTLNLAGGHYLKIAVDVQLVKGKLAATDFQPGQAQELVIDEFSNRAVESLATNAARQKLTAELLVKVQKAYKGEVFNIFLTQFVTQ